MPSQGPELQPLPFGEVSGPNEGLAAQEKSPTVTELTSLVTQLKAKQSFKRKTASLVGDLQGRLGQWQAKVEPPAEPAPASLPLSKPEPANASASTSTSPVEQRLATPKLNGNGRASSPDGSGNDSEGMVRQPKKRKHDKLVIGSDGDYSDSETQPEPPTTKVRKLDRADPQQTSILEALPLPGHTRPALERKDSDQKMSSAASPAAQSPAGTPSGLSLKLKLSHPPPKIEAPIRKGPLPPGTADDFSMPSRPLVPPKPVTMPPQPLPKSQIEVTGDFDVPKPNQQTPYQTFVSSVEPYLRSFGDDDLAFLSVKSEDIQPFLIPALGRYYAEQWADEDAGVFPSPSRSTAAPNSSPLKPPALQRSRPSDLTDDNLATEHVAMGPLSERLVAALGEEGLAEISSEMAVDEIDGPAATTSTMDAVELEDRLKKELRFLGVFPTDGLAPLSASLSSVAATGEVDWAARTDDEISTALRACQRALRDQIGINEARKARLASLVRDRMAYQEFEGTRDGLEKVIETGWIKRQRHGKPKKPKPLKPGEKAGSVPPAGSSQPTAPEAKAVVEPKPPMPEELLLQLDRRKRYIGAFDDLFGEAEEGRWRGLPSHSVFDDDPLTQVEPVTTSNVQ